MPQNGEVHREDIALFAARKVARRLVNGGHFAVREGGGVKARRLLRVLVEPEADGVLWLHVVSPCARIGLSKHSLPWRLPLSRTISDIHVGASGDVHPADAG